MPKVVEFKSLLSTTLDKLYAFHNDPRALAILTPPPVFIQLKRDDRKSLTSGQVEFIMWLGPIPLRWVANHEPGPSEFSFQDRMLSGPMGFWLHQHIFSQVGDKVQLLDRISLEHPAGLKGLFTRLFFDGLPLRFMFAYRHWRTRRALSKS